MSTDVVTLPDREEFEQGVRQALRPHLVPGQDRFISSLREIAGMQISGGAFAGVLVDRFGAFVNTNGAGPEYTVPLLKKVVNQFTSEGTPARTDAHQRINRLAG